MDQASVPVVPVAIIGGDKDYLRRAFTFRRPEIEMRIGKPLPCRLLKAAAQNAAPPASGMPIW